MPVLETFRLDTFSVVILIVIFLVLIYIIISAFYWYDFFKDTPSPPTHNEAVTMFWVSIVLGIILLICVFYALYHIWSFRIPLFIKSPSNVGIEANKPGKIIFVENPNPNYTVVTTVPGKIVLT